MEVTMSIPTLFVLIMLSVMVKKTVPYSTGQPDNEDICRKMTPGHENTAPQSLPPPFTITVNRKTYRLSEKLTVTLKMLGLEKFKGFAIQARRVDPSRDLEPVGHFQMVAPGTKVVCNRQLGNGLTHTNGTPGSGQLKSEINFTWSTIASHGHIHFRVTVVTEFNRYWVAEPSDVVYDAMIPTTSTPKPGLAFPMLPDVITTEGCGRTKGCYRNPPSCHDTACDIFVSWVVVSAEYVDFQLVGNTDGWVAVGFSDDKKMGKEDVYECVWNNTRDLVEVRLSHNSELGKNNTVQSTAMARLQGTGVQTAGQIRCQFRAKKMHLNGKFHLLLAKGQVNPTTGLKKIHVLEPGKYPYVSPVKVSMDEKLADITDTARYALVKVHGCLMLIGWMMCASTALILAKYYKPMWPNDRICGERVWFVVHTSCMVTCLFCTIIAFIVIFVHADGYSQMPDLPAKAHPILGIITTILCILNPLIALCKCHDKSEYRPIFNWIHWFVGTCGTVLATPTLMIGLNLPKAHVPWWATWVMVAFMLFHLIIELLLEIHGCLNSSKQKYRNQEYEMRKHKDDREPEPVGRRFKKIILTIYVIVVICLGIVMVISVAAG